MVPLVRLPLPKTYPMGNDVGKNFVNFLNALAKVVITKLSPGSDGSGTYSFEVVVQRTGGEAVHCHELESVEI